MVVKLVAGMCRLSLAFHVACNNSPNVRRSNSGYQVYAGRLEAPKTIVKTESLHECSVE